MKIDWKLKGWNLLKFGCSRDSVIHPETCSDVVLMGHNGSQSLTDWITKDQTNPSLGNSLTDWITNIFIQTVGDETQFIINADYAPASEDWDITNSLLLGTLNNEHEIRVPYGSVSSYGAFKVGEGLRATNGVLAVKAANTTEFGGFKLYQATDVLPNNCLRVQLDANGKAYSDLRELSIENYLQDWSGANLTYAARIYTASDGFSNLNLNDYYQTFVNYFATNIPSASRIYPVRADRFGRLYAFVNWSQTPISIFAGKPSGSDCGYVPTAGSVTDKANKYLNENGNWASVSYNSLLNRPSVLGGSTTSGFLVPSSSGGNTKFLRGDGAWAIPTGTTYEPASEGNPNGLLSVYNQITDATGCTVIATAATPTIIAPVRYEKNIEIHGIVLDDLMEDTTFLRALATALAPIIENDTDLKAAWQAALAQN